MPHAVEIEKPARSTRTPKSKASSSKELRQLHALYSQTKELYLQSNLYRTISRLLEAKNRPAIKKIVSLGLGSLKSTDQSRRLKQLAIFIAIVEQLRQYEPELEIYAQDPAFSKTDEAFLQSLDVNILSTRSATESGEAAHVIDESTLVYSPFLTLEAYRLFFSTENFNFFIGDDFDALRMKWPKHSAGREEAESLLRQYVQSFRKRAIGGDDAFWEAEEKPFPMAMYQRASSQPKDRRPRAKL